MKKIIKQFQILVGGHLEVDSQFFFFSNKIYNLISVSSYPSFLTVYLFETGTYVAQNHLRKTIVKDDWQLLSQLPHLPNAQTCKSELPSMYFCGTKLVKQMFYE